MTATAVEFRAILDHQHRLQNVTLHPAARAQHDLLGADTAANRAPDDDILGEDFAMHLARLAYRQTGAMNIAGDTAFDAIVSLRGQRAAEHGPGADD